jgi:hypothetical protein
MCMWRGALVADPHGRTIRMMEGLPLGSSAEDSLADDSVVTAAPRAALIAAAAPVLLKELAHIIADYARAPSVRTIAGTPNVMGHADGHALREAKLYAPCAVAIDDSDPVAGPQLIICGGDHAIRCLNLRSEQVSTLAGDGFGGHKDGPLSTATFYSSNALAVTPSSGVIFVAENVRSPRCPPPPAHLRPHRHRRLCTCTRAYLS